MEGHVEVVLDTVTFNTLDSDKFREMCSQGLRSLLCHFIGQASSPMNIAALSLRYTFFNSANEVGETEVCKHHDLITETSIKELEDEIKKYTAKAEHRMTVAKGMATQVAASARYFDTLEDKDAIKFLVVVAPFPRTVDDMKAFSLSADDEDVSMHVRKVSGYFKSPMITTALGNGKASLYWIDPLKHRAMDSTLTIEWRSCFNELSIWVVNLETLLLSVGCGRGQVSLTALQQQSGKPRTTNEDAVWRGNVVACQEGQPSSDPLEFGGVAVFRWSEGHHSCWELNAVVKPVGKCDNAIAASNGKRIKRARKKVAARGDEDHIVLPTLVDSVQHCDLLVVSSFLPVGHVRPHWLIGSDVFWCQPSTPQGDAHAQTNSAATRRGSGSSRGRRGSGGSGSGRRTPMGVDGVTLRSLCSYLQTNDLCGLVHFVKKGNAGSFQTFSKSFKACAMSAVMYVSGSVLVLRPVRVDVLHRWHPLPRAPTSSSPHVIGCLITPETIHTDTVNVAMNGDAGAADGATASPSQLSSFGDWVRHEAAREAAGARMSDTCYLNGRHLSEKFLQFLSKSSLMDASKEETVRDGNMNKLVKRLQAAIAQRSTNDTDAANDGDYAMTRMAEMDEADDSEDVPLLLKTVEQARVYALENYSRICDEHKNVRNSTHEDTIAKLYRLVNALGKSPLYQPKTIREWKKVFEDVIVKPKAFIQAYGSASKDEKQLMYKLQIAIRLALSEAASDKPDPMPKMDFKEITTYLGFLSIASQKDMGDFLDLQLVERFSESLRATLLALYKHFDVLSIPAILTAQSATSTRQESAAKPDEPMSDLFSFDNDQPFKGLSSSPKLSSFPDFSRGDDDRSSGGAIRNQLDEVQKRQLNHFTMNMAHGTFWRKEVKIPAKEVKQKARRKKRKDKLDQKKLKEEETKDCDIETRLAKKVKKESTRRSEAQAVVIGKSGSARAPPSTSQRRHSSRARNGPDSAARPIPETPMPPPRQTKSRAAKRLFSDMTVGETPLRRSPRHINSKRHGQELLVHETPLAPWRQKGAGVGGIQAAVPSDASPLSPAHLPPRLPIPTMGALGVDLGVPGVGGQLVDLNWRRKPQAQTPAIAESPQPSPRPSQWSSPFS